MSIYIFAGIVVLILASLIISAISYSRQQAYKERKKKLFSLKTRTDEILNYQRLLLHIDQDFTIILYLQKQLLQLIRAARNIAPEDAQLKALHISHEHHLAKYSAGKRDNPVECVVASDSELSNVQMQLLHISKHLDVCRNRGTLDSQTHENMLAHIQKLKLDLDVNSHMHQAQVCGTQGDMVLYQLHLKQARDALSKTKLDVPNKTDRIKQLSDMLNHAKRTNRVYASADSAPLGETPSITPAPSAGEEPQTP